MRDDLTSKRVLVVGAGGRGEATAARFGRAGAHVVGAGRPGPKLDEVAAAAGAQPASLDVLDVAGVEAFFATR